MAASVLTASSSSSSSSSIHAHPHPHSRMSSTSYNSGSNNSNIASTSRAAMEMAVNTHAHAQRTSTNSKAHTRPHPHPRPRPRPRPRRTHSEDEGDVDDLELLEAQDLLDYDDDDDDDDDDREDHDGYGYDSRSDGERGRGADDDDDGDDTDGIFAELKATTVEIVSALGGLEEVEDEATGAIHMVYVVGDDCLRCLRDLRKLWHQGGDDPDRLVAHVFAHVAVLQNLVPLLLKTAGGNERYQKIALACTDLLTSITWPVDADGLVREQVRRGEDTSRMGHLYALERNMVAYKAAILRQSSGESKSTTTATSTPPTVLSSVMRHILLPAMAKPAPKRTERDVATISMVLHLFRNLLAIRDPVATSLSSAEQIQNSTLQSDLVCAMQRTHILDTLLMLADSAETRDFNQWNAITLECIYAVFGGEEADKVLNTNDTPNTIGTDANASRTHAATATPSPSSALAAFLSSEARQRQVALKSSGSSRHSRFGTTLNFLTATGDRRVARNASSLRKSVSDLRTENTLRSSRKKSRRRRAAREQGAPAIRGEWTREAQAVLRDWADRFLLGSGFETLARSVLKDILSEREKMGDLDEARMRFMLLSAFFLDYFQLRRQRQGEPSITTAADNASDDAAAPLRSWSFSLLAYWLQQWPFRLVKARTENALDARNWQELTAALRLYISLLRLVDGLTKSGTEAERDVADSLLSRHFYQQEVLDLCVRVGGSFRAQSFEFLQTVIAFVNLMPKVLERYATNREHIFVRAKAHVRKARAKRAEGDNDGEGDDGDGNPAATEHEETEERTNTVYTERRFSFEKFQSKLCTRPLVHASVAYLLRWRDFSHPAEHLAAVTAVMHRIAIKASDVRSFFEGDTRASFRTLLQGPLVATLAPRAPAAVKDTQRLLQYCLKRFEKLPEEEKTLWEGGKRPPRPPKASKAGKTPRHPREVQVLPGLTRDDQLGVAVGLLAGRHEHGVKRVLWLKAALEAASAERTATALRIDARRMWEASRRTRIADGEDEADVPLDPADEDNEAILAALTDEGAPLPSDEAVAAFRDFPLAYGGEDPDEVQRLTHDATTSPPVKLLARLLGLVSDERDPAHWAWTVPARLLPLHLDADAKLLEGFISQPLRLPARGGGGGADDGEGEGEGRTQSYEDWVRPVPRKRGAGGGGAGPAAGVYDSDSDSETDASASDSDASQPRAGKGKRPRRRADLVGDPRKVKRAKFDQLRKSKKNHAPLFLREDVIGSDEEEEVERAWRKHIGEGAGASSGTGARAGKRRGGSDSDAEMEEDERHSGTGSGSGSESDTPATSPPPDSLARAQAQKQSERERTRKRKSTALFFSSDEEDDGGEGERDAPAPAPVRTGPSRSPSPTLTGRVKPLYSDDSEEEEEEEEEDQRALSVSPSPPASPSARKRGAPVARGGAAREGQDEDEDEDAPIVRAGTQPRRGVARAGAGRAAMLDSDEE